MLRVESLRDVIADKRERIVELEGDLEVIVKVCGRRMSVSSSGLRCIRCILRRHAGS